MSKSHTSVKIRTRYKKGRSYEVREEINHFVSNNEIKKRFKSKPAKNHWAGKNFNKKGWK